MLFYKFTKQLFKNRLDAKLTLGHSNFNRLYSEYPDDFIFIDNSLANDDYTIKLIGYNQ